MLAIISIDFMGDSEGVSEDFATEMSAFGWEQHPAMRDVFVAKFVNSAADDDVIETACFELRVCLGTVNVERWQASVATARRITDPAEVSWDHN